MKRNLILFVSFFVFGAVQAQEKWDLRKCVEYALNNNISIRQSDIQAQIQSLTYKESKFSQIPSLNFGTSAGVNTGRSIDRTTNQFTTESIFYNGFSLQSNVDIFNWFSKKNGIAGNRLQAEAAVASVQKLKDDISLNVAATYLQALLAKEQVNLSRLQIEQTLSQIDNTEKLVNAGSLPELNLAELQSQLAQDSLTLVTAIGTEVKSLLLLKATLNIDAGTAFDITTPPVEKIPVDPIAELQPEAVYQLALVNLPQQRVNTLKLQSARKFAEAAKGNLYPSISMGGSIQTNYSNLRNQYRVTGVNFIKNDTIGLVQGSNTPVIAPNYQVAYDFFSKQYGRQISDNLSNNVSINLSVPIFNGRSARTNLEKQRLNVKNLALQQELDNRNLKQDIYNAYTDAITALQKFNAADKAVAAAEKALNYSRKRYEVGLLNSIDLITNQNNLFRANINKLSARFEYVFKMKVLEFYKGQGIKL
ncbi:MAG: TolC family protein [Terrimonas sp.]|nr:TolC family protein [Terrimonas sp.]